MRTCLSCEAPSRGVFCSRECFYVRCGLAVEDARGRRRFIRVERQVHAGVLAAARDLLRYDQIIGANADEHLLRAIEFVTARQQVSNLS